MKKLFTSLLFLIFGILLMSAQQLPLFTQYSEYQGLINPSAINYNYFLDKYPTSFGLSARRQWWDVPSSPVTYVGKGEHIDERRSAVSMLYGGYLINDRTGDISSTGAYGRIAGIFTGKNGADEGGLSLGLMGGIVQYRIDIASLYEKFGDDPKIGEQTVDNLIRPDIGIGLTYYKKIRKKGIFRNDYVFAGLSVPQLLGISLEYGSENNSFYISRIQHFYLTGTYIKTFSEGRHIELSTWVKKVKNIPTNFDVILRYRFVDSMWFGVGINNSRIAHLEYGLFLGEALGFSDNAFKVGFAYNPTLTNYGINFGRTLELSIAYLRF